MRICIVGIGLIGGSLAKDLRANGFASELIGVDNNKEHIEIALAEGLIDKAMSLEEACIEADIIVLAIPVNGIMKILSWILDKIGKDTLVIDMGSTKRIIADEVRGHENRSQLVLAHPMAGTEFSGPMAAVDNLFHGKAAIICDQEDSSRQASDTAVRLFKSLFMRVIYMDSASHDMHAAYVSHISHISSFVLALTVLEQERNATNIFNMASGGFESTVRLAKSSPRMWNDIYEQNSDNILDVLESYITKMQYFRDCIKSNTFDKTYNLMEEANAIKDILDKKFKTQLIS